MADFDYQRYKSLSERIDQHAVILSQITRDILTHIGGENIPADDALRALERMLSTGFKRVLSAQEGDFNAIIAEVAESIDRRQQFSDGQINQASAFVGTGASRNVRIAAPTVDFVALPSPLPPQLQPIIPVPVFGAPQPNNANCVPPYPQDVPWVWYDGRPRNRIPPCYGLPEGCSAEDVRDTVLGISADFQSGWNRPDLGAFCVSQPQAPPAPVPQPPAPVPAEPAPPAPPLFPPPAPQPAPPEPGSCSIAGDDLSWLKVDSLEAKLTLLGISTDVGLSKILSGADEPRIRRALCFLINGE